MSSDELQFCKDWCGAHAKTWQVLSRSQWKYQFHPKTLVRYVDEVRLAETEVRLILEFLSSDDCIDTLSLYDQSIANTWKPTRAWLEMGQKSVNGVRSVRLYHGLMTEVSDGDGPYIVEKGCAYKVTFTYYWNQSTVQTCPQSESGISYQIVSLSRDSETGLYSYAIEKRERIQQDVPLYLTAETVYEQHKEETHLGVKQSEVAATGQAAGVSNGTIVQRKLSKNADCTSDVHNNVTVEKPVAKSSRTARMTLRGLVVSTESKNQDAVPDDPTNIGDTVSYSKTPGGLYDTRKESAPTGSAGVVEEADGKTAFEDTHRTETNVSRDSSETATTTFSTGTLRRKSVTRRDDGTKDVSEIVMTAKPWEETKCWEDAYHKRERCQYKNQSSPIIWTTNADRTTVSNTYSKNEYGLYDGSCERSVTKVSGGDEGEQTEDTSDEAVFVVKSGVRRIGGVKKQLVRKDKIVKHVIYNTYKNWRKLMNRDLAKHGIPKNVDPNEYAAYQPKQLGAFTWQFFTFEIGTPQWENIE